MASSCSQVVLLLVMVSALTGAKELQAVCVVDSTTGSGAENISGTIVFKQTVGDNVTITVKLSGFKENVTTKHGFHVHAIGALGNACKAAGGHYNPLNKQHGGPADAERHVGDLGNVIQNNAGEVITVIRDRMVSLEGTHSVIGKSIVIHEGEDDLGKGEYPDSNSTGHAGARLGCCIIKFVPVNNVASGISLHTGLLVVATVCSVWRLLSLE